jgi:class 3 adenylate cyclase/glyoxylase-like metal-dependent hydrolase (beta-lactamase superfamily II)
MDRFRAAERSRAMPKQTHANTKLDDTNAIKVADDIWWVGFADYEAGFSNNPYLLVDGDEAVLFDPGPGHPLFRDLVMQKIEQVTAPEKVRYVVVHHQDPDLCGLLPFIENFLHPDVVIMSHPRTALFLPYYGLRKGVLPLGDGDILEMKSGRRISFFHAPYLHFAGNIMSYDEKTESLFSGDVFAVFNREWSLYADDSYIDLARNFIEHYIASKEPVLYAYEKIKKLSLKRILPQHGGVIEDNIEGFLDMLKDAEPGQLIKELKSRPSPEQVEEFFETGKKWLERWLKRDVEADSLDELMKIAMREGPSTVSLLIDIINERAKASGVANPLTYSHVHQWDTIWSAQTSRILDSLRRRFLSRQYGMWTRGRSDVSDVLEQRLQAFKTQVGVMLVDIRGFTKWSAERPPDEVVGTLDRELELVTRIIHSRGGRVNKVMGDGLLAYFPAARLDDCVEAATMIQDSIAENKLLPVGVGCDFGEVIMGDIGQELRLDYTLIGPTVNFAARMCDRAKKGEVALTKMVVDRLTEETRKRLFGSHSSKEFKTRVKPTDPEIEGVVLSSLAP